MRINALLSGFSPSLVMGGENLRPSGRGLKLDIRQESVLPDVFEQGQPWKNLATAGRTAARSEGAHAAYAAQAYAAQAGTKENIPFSAAVPAGKEEKAAGASAAGEQGEADAVSKEQQEAGQGGSGAVKEKAQPGTGAKNLVGEGLTQAQQLQVAELEQIDTKVRAHELAHLAVAGAYATSGASFQYAKGPDGKQYAVGGEVGIDTGKEADPEATISKMQTVRAAALAPADPSPQDQKVAAEASLVISEASQELQMIRLQQSKEQATGKDLGQVGLGGKSLPEAGVEDSVPAEQAQANVSASSSPSSAQKAAAAIMAGLMRPLPTIHLAV